MLPAYKWPAGVVTGIAATCAALSLLWPELRKQGLLESSLVVLAVAFGLGRAFPTLDNT